MSNAANQAIIAEMGQTQAVRDAKRDLFEQVAHEHYLERWPADVSTNTAMTREEFCRRDPAHPDRYFYVELNNTWWGFQAGFTAAALAGAKA